MRSTSDNISGKTKQVVGKVIGNKKLQAKGKVQEASGNLKGKLKDAGKKLTDKVDKTAR
jgi:uncharacterized protein YjbJ (UPF0337 family)